MTVLRQKVIEDMQLHGFASRTQEAYLSAVRQLAGHYHKPPGQINEELRQYFHSSRMKNTPPVPPAPLRYAGSSSFLNGR